ncbi:unnamed protein product [Boreogadus saida]
MASVARSRFGGTPSCWYPSHEDEEDYSFAPCTASPMLVGGACASSPIPAVGVDLHEACKGAAARLTIEWPEPPVETAPSRYEDKRLPKAKASTVAASSLSRVSG